MLIKVERPDGREVRFEYDALGRRVRKTFAGISTRWIWDGNVPLHEWQEGSAEHALPQPVFPLSPALRPPRDAQWGGPPPTGPPPGAVAAEVAQTPAWPALPPKLKLSRQMPTGLITWLFEPESYTPMAKLTETARLSIVSDYLGVPVLMLDARGEKVWSAEIGVYGKLRAVEGNAAACPFRWPGQYEDIETGLYYNRFRYYDPDAGQYIRQDPIGPAGGLALHGYVRDPLGWVDPAGLTCQSPSDLVSGGRLSHTDINAWASSHGLTNHWQPSSKFPAGGFKYHYTHGGYSYTVHGHGSNPSAVTHFPGSNAATGPTASITRTPVGGGAKENFRTDGTWGSFGSNPDGAHIPLDNSPY